MLKERKQPEPDITDKRPAAYNNMDSERKHDHISLAFKSQMIQSELDDRFFYEPLLSAHPSGSLEPTKFLGKQMNAPIWISSMTGGTELAYNINRNLARACKEFGLGMGLGSCRSLLDGDAHFEDFNLRPVIGDDRLFFANLGVAQIERALETNTQDKIIALVDRLETDGLIIHVNPFQEWLQPEGDLFKKPPVETIASFLECVDFKVIVKEVGQGMGPESMKKLFQLPLAAIDCAAHGGTNFSKVELLRSGKEKRELYNELAYVGHNAKEMVLMSNLILEELGNKAACRNVIISGGIKSFLDGYYLINKIRCASVYGQGSAFLEYARNSYEELHHFIDGQIRGLSLASAYLRVK